MALLKEAERLQDDVRANHAGLTGELRITTTPEYGARVVVPLLAVFSQQHTDLRVRHVSSSLHADLISERFDVAIRLGTLVDSRNHAALISHFSILPVATPEWLAGNPIETLAQLAQADWIIHERLASPLRWQVKDARGAPDMLEIKRRRVCLPTALRPLWLLRSQAVGWRYCRNGWCAMRLMRERW